MPAPVYLSINEFDGDGVTTQHEFAFAGGYIDRTHVKAYITNALGVITPVTVTNGMFVTDNTLDLGVFAPIGGITRIYRDTPRDEPLLDFTDNARITAANLDLLARQTVLCVAEAFDAGAYAAANDLLGAAGAALAQAAAAVAAADAAVIDATAQAALAAAQVVLAEAQVGLAADQVGLAEDQVGLAEAQVAIALSHANDAGADAAAAAASAVDSAASAAASAASAIVHSGRSVRPTDFGFVLGMPDARAAVQAALDAHTGNDVVILTDDYNIPSGTLLLPAGVRVEGDKGRLIRTRDSKERLLVNAGNPSVRVRGLTLHTTAGAVATTPGPVAAVVGSTVFTVPAGLNIAVSDYVYVMSYPTGTAVMYGAVTAYSGTSMTVNVATVSGSGSSASWRIGHADGEALALRDHAGIDAVYEGLRATGSWYVALELLNSDGCTIQESVVTAAVNRALYVYATSGTAKDCNIRNNTVRGGGITNYGINVNGSTAGTIDRLQVDGNSVISTVFQGVAIGGNVQDGVVVKNRVSGTLQGPAIMVQRANSSSPVRNTVSNNVAQGGGGQGVLVQDCFYTQVLDNAISGCTTGVHLDQATYASGNYYHTVSGNVVNANTTHGIHVSATGASLGGNSIITNNMLIGNPGTGLLTAATSYRCRINDNFSIANGTAYSILGTSHSTGTNV